VFIARSQVVILSIRYLDLPRKESRQSLDKKTFEPHTRIRRIAKELAYI
jgi:hypothetical protein